MNIVFVHFRAKPPRHLILNIKRTIKLFPEHRVYLITDFNSPKFKIKGLICYEYKKNKDWEGTRHRGQLGRIRRPGPLSETPECVRPWSRGRQTRA